MGAIASPVGVLFPSPGKTQFFLVFLGLSMVPSESGDTRLQYTYHLKVKNLLIINSSQMLHGISTNAKAVRIVCWFSWSMTMSKEIVLMEYSSLFLRLWPCLHSALITCHTDCFKIFRNSLSTTSPLPCLPVYHC